MKWSFTSIAFVVLGLVGLSVIILFEKLTTSNENDYYLLKEITQAAMYDSIDYDYYEENREVRIVKEKFVENFTRRYAESTLFIGSKYIISFYDIIESPPKVTVWINNGIEDFQLYNNPKPDNFNIDNTITAILEYYDEESGAKDPNYVPGESYSTIVDKLTTKKSVTETYYSSVPVENDGNMGATQALIIPEDIKYKEEQIREKSLDIEKIEYSVVSPNSTGFIGEVMQAKLKRELSWASAATDYRTGDGYYKEIKPEEYVSDITFNNVYWYNCNTHKGTKHSNMNCEKYKDYGGYWIHWDGKTTNTGKKEAVVKLTIKWIYEDYESIEY